MICQYGKCVFTSCGRLFERCLNCKMDASLYTSQKGDPTTLAMILPICKSYLENGVLDYEVYTEIVRPILGDLLNRQLTAPEAEYLGLPACRDGELYDRLEQRAMDVMDGIAHQRGLLPAQS